MHAEVERKARFLGTDTTTVGKLTVEFHLKDGKWTLGNVSVTFPRVH